MQQIMLGNYVGNSDHAIHAAVLTFNGAVGDCEATSIVCDFFLPTFKYEELQAVGWWGERGEKKKRGEKRERRGEKKR